MRETMKACERLVRLAPLACLPLTTLAAEPQNSASPEAHESRAEWMRGGCGIMVHWLYPKAGEIDTWVDAFDLNGFLSDFDHTGADWLIFTIGQNRGAYASPSATIEKYAGPGHCSRRDLVREIARATKARGKRFIAYIPSEIKANPTMHAGFRWNDDAADRHDFQNRWTELLEEWSRRLGGNCDGWWLDGSSKRFHPNGLDIALWTKRLRTGNGRAVLAHNPGMRLYNDLFGSDYTAGETCFIGEAPDPEKTKVAKSCVLHYLLPIDGYWGAYWHWPDWCNRKLKTVRPEICNADSMNKLMAEGKFPDPIYTKDELSRFGKQIMRCKAAVTFNIGIGPTGRLNPKSIDLVSELSNAPSGSERRISPMVEGRNSPRPTPADECQDSAELPEQVRAVRDAASPGRDDARIQYLPYRNEVPVRTVAQMPRTARHAHARP